MKMHAEGDLQEKLGVGGAQLLPPALRNVAETNEDARRRSELLTASPLCP